MLRQLVTQRVFNKNTLEDVKRGRTPPRHSEVHQ